MKFRLWLENVEKDRRYWEDFFLSVYRLDRNSGGLGKNLAGFDPKNLTNTSQFSEIPPERQQAILNKIQSGDGTIGDLAAIASGDDPVANKPQPKFSVPVQQSDFSAID